MRSEEHQKFLIDQYNRNRQEKDHVKDMAELNRALLTNEIKHFGMRSVTITERRVYYKSAKITIELPKDLSIEDTQDWLEKNTSKWEQSLDNEFNNATLKSGTGVLECDGMSYESEDRETRYDVNNEKYGGHL
tara:strand:+ start:526 stop:924 length:399 start_codon:yes stop_codon:yes gene_type:complete